MESLIAALMLWIVTNSDYSAVVDPPNVVIATDFCELIETVTHVPDCNKEGFRIEELYNSVTDTIYLPPNWDKNKPYDVGFLLHGLVHYFQDKSGRMLGYQRSAAKRCELETEAYRLQHFWHRDNRTLKRNWIGVGRYFCRMLLGVPNLKGGIR